MGGGGYSNNSITIPTREKLIIGLTIGGYFFVIFAAFAIAMVADNHGHRNIPRWAVTLVLLLTFPFWAIFAICSPSVRKHIVSLGRAVTRIWGGDLGEKVSGFWDRRRKREVEGTELGKVQGEVQEERAQEVPGARL